jgi:uncharacterized protein
VNPGQKVEQVLADVIESLMRGQCPDSGHVRLGTVTGENEAEIGEVNAFWQGLGLPGLVDVHVHFMPPNVQAKVWDYFDQAGEGRAWPIVYRLAEGDLVGLLRAFGLRRFGALAYPHKPDMAEWLNTWSVEFAARTPDALQSATFFPEPSAGRYVAEAIEAGARLFKAHVQVGGYDPRDPLLEPVWAALAESGVPLIIHCGSGPMPGAFTGPGPISEVLARHPGLTLIVAHMGAPEFGEFLDLVSWYPRVHLDTTMVFTDFWDDIALFPAEMMPALADLGDRILLGSDFPSIPYPYVTQLRGLAKLDLGDEWLRAVCWENPVRLLGL